MLRNGATVETYSERGCSGWGWRGLDGRNCTSETRLYGFDTQYMTEWTLLWTVILIWWDFYTILYISRVEQHTRTHRRHRTVTLFLQYEFLAEVAFSAQFGSRATYDRLGNIDIFLMSPLAVTKQKYYNSPASWRTLKKRWTSFWRTAIGGRCKRLKSSLNCPFREKLFMFKNGPFAS